MYGVYRFHTSHYSSIATPFFMHCTLDVHYGVKYNILSYVATPNFVHALCAVVMLLVYNYIIMIFHLLT